MKIHLETERLLLRDLETSDASDLFAMDSDPEVHRFLGQKPITEISEATAVIDFIRAQYKANGIGRWAVVLKNSNQFIGWAGLKLMTEPINGHLNYYDLGYRLNRSHWGRGYATEATIALRDYAFTILKAEYIYAIAETGNSQSLRILKKCGMSVDGTFEYDGSPHYWLSLKNGSVTGY